MDLSNWDYDAALAAFQGGLTSVADQESLARYKDRYLNKKDGVVTGLLGALRTVPPELKPKLGPSFNRFKKEVEQALKAKLASLQQSGKRAMSLDTSLPGARPTIGTMHPLTRVWNDMVDFFVRMGYDVGEGPEIETNFFNFEALNTPEDHPARDEADTFYIDDERLLRTQTSGVQIRYMQKHNPPFRMVAPGKVFRRDDDATHSPMFHQLEGLVVGRDIHFGHLKGTLEAFAKHLFGAKSKIRLRPSYFPFTEPSAEMDVSCPFCSDGCRVCKKTGWIEILGCGMVDPNVFRAVGYDAEKFTGFAFGIGIERVAMLHLEIPHIRFFYQNDKRFLDQFKVV